MAADGGGWLRVGQSSVETLAKGKDLVHSSSAFRRFLELAIPREKGGVEDAGGRGSTQHTHKTATTKPKRICQ